MKTGWSSKKDINNIFEGEQHRCIIGATGSGKTTSFMIPGIFNGIDNGHIQFVLDSKMTAYNATAGYAIKMGCKVFTFDYRDPQKSDGFEPLDEASRLLLSKSSYDNNRGEFVLENITYSLIPDEPDGTDAFWTNCGRTGFKGAFHTLLKCADTPEQINFPNIYNTISDGTKKYALGTYLSEANKDSEPDDPAYLGTNIFKTAADTQAGIVTTALDGISHFACNKSIASMQARNNFRISNLTCGNDDKYIVYIIVPEEMKGYYKHAAMLLTQIINHFINMAEEEYAGRLPRTVSIWMDELGNIGDVLPQLPSLIAASRSRNIQLNLSLQSISQLETIYGRASKESIMANIGTTILLKTADWDTLVLYSKMCGEVTRCVNGQIIKKPVITPEQLFSFKVGEALVLAPNGVKYTARLSYYKDAIPLEKLVSAPELTVKEPGKHYPFDIKKYVTDLKKAEMEKSLGKKSTKSTDKALEPATPTISAFSEKDINSMMKDIEEELRKMDEQEELEKKNMDKRPYVFTITNCNNNIPKIARMLSFVINKSFMKIALDLEELPYKVAVDTKYDFETVERGLKELGATFSVKKKEVNHNET